MSVGEVFREPAAAAVLSAHRDNGFFMFDPEKCETTGSALQEEYRRNQPFPHIVLDDFLDLDILHRVNAEFPQREKGRFSDNYSRLKTGYTHAQIRSAYVHDLLNALNSLAFLKFLEN